MAIAEGTLDVTRKRAADEKHQAGLVVEMCGEKLARFSLYLNARNRWLWSDAVIL